MVRTTAAQALMPAITDQQISDFRQKGAVLLKSMISPEWMDLVSEGLEASNANPGDMMTRAIGTGGEGKMLIDQFVSLRNDQLRKFRDESPVAAIAGTLLGSSAARFYIDQMFYKDAGRILPTNWHQDTPYLRMAGNDICRLWITCDPSPSTVTVRVVKGSHLWNVTYAPNPDTPEVGEVEVGAGFSYGTNEDYDQSLIPVPEIDSNRDGFDVMTWDVEPGDVLAFNGNILHGAGGVDRHPIKRRALATVWTGDDVRYRARVGLTLPDLAQFAGAEIADGDLLSDHEDVWRAQWRKESESA